MDILIEHICPKALYLTIIIWLVMKSLLMFVALKYNDGEVKTLMFMMFGFDMILIFSYPLLLYMFAGVCPV